MTPTEILEEIYKLPSGEWETIKERVDGAKNSHEKTPMTEDEFAQYLFTRGIIGNVPDFSELTDEDDEFEPINVLGEPLSEMIIRERR